MMKPVFRISGAGADPSHGQIKYDKEKVIWNLGMIVLAIIFAPFTFAFNSFLLFAFLTYFSLLIGHSAGLHRMMIHRTFKCPKYVERTLIYIGVLVGMSGPFGIIKIHDTRDWAQRQTHCHDFFSHNAGYMQDIWWQLTSRFVFDSPPRVNIESRYLNDPFYVGLERNWKLHQLVFAVFLYLIGGWDFVVWGVFVRVSVSILGHWTITYFCHNPGPGIWKVKKAYVQASNIPGLGLLTYGECWHNNHHAFPESAKIGIYKSQSDPGWWFIKGLEYLGLAKNVQLPRVENQRDDLEKVSS